jgi:DNA-directed RNA polymerase subunit RPC12/RpoP
MNCPKCNKEIELDVSKALDERGEIFICPHCGYKFIVL